MRLRVVIPAMSLMLIGVTACASTAEPAAAPARKAPAAPTVAARQSDPVLILGGATGAVSVRTTTGAVAFRAPYGMAAPDSSTIVQAQPMVAGTRVVASDPLTGVPRWSHDIAGARRVRVVSPGGRFVALVDGSLNVASQPRAETVIDVATATGVQALRIPGNLDPEAFSVDGRSLYAVDFLPAMNPTRYTVRRIDLRTHHVTTVPDRNGAVRTPMPGYSSTQLMSPDGNQLYTFYSSAEPVTEDGDSYHAWVHVLNLEHGWAHCVDLDEDIAVSGSANAGLAITPDGSRLFVTDGVSHAVAAIDTATLRVERTRFLPSLANTDASAVDATDGHTIFARDPSGGLSTINAQTLAPETVSIDAAAQITAIHMDRSAESLYLLTTSGLLVVDRRGHVIKRWPAPGDATSIDPAVTVPGRGAYQCAC